MKHPHVFAWLIAVLVIANSLSLHAAPEDHLAPTPQASKVEAEVIALLQVSPPSFLPGGEVILKVYNPTTYILRDCVIRIEIPSRNINRIYTSGHTNIPPNKDGEFSIKTAISNPNSETSKIEILKLNYEPAKK